MEIIFLNFFILLTNGRWNDIILSCYVRDMRRQKQSWKFTCLCVCVCIVFVCKRKFIWKEARRCMKYWVIKKKTLKKENWKLTMVVVCKVFCVCKSYDAYCIWLNEKSILCLPFYTSEGKNCIICIRYIVSMSLSSASASLDSRHD